MEPFPEDLFVHCIKELVKVDKDWVLPSPGALYIRPSMIPLDKGVSYRASQDYRFFVILSPSKNYFPVKPLSLSILKISFACRNWWWCW